MKKFSILALTLMLAMAFASCSKDQLKEQAMSKGTDKAVEVAKTDSCKSDCDKTADACVKKAGKDKKKADACAKAKTKCYADCDKK